MEQDGQHVYYLSPDHRKLTRVIDDLKQPNGIIGTPDGKRLYIADIGDRKIYSYTIKSDGTLSDKKLFTDMGSDGMTIDDAGNVYLVGKGVTVFNSRGEDRLHSRSEAMDGQHHLRRKEHGHLVHHRQRCALFDSDTGSRRAVRRLIFAEVRERPRDQCRA